MRRRWEERLGELHQPTGTDLRAWIAQDAHIFRCRGQRRFFLFSCPKLAPAARTAAATSIARPCIMRTWDRHVRRRRGNVTFLSLPKEKRALRSIIVAYREKDKGRARKIASRLWPTEKQQTQRPAARGTNERNRLKRQSKKKNNIINKYFQKWLGARKKPVGCFRK